MRKTIGVAWFFFTLQPLTASEDFAKCIHVETRMIGPSLVPGTNYFALVNKFEFRAVNQCHSTFKEVRVNFKFFDKDGYRFSSTSMLNGELLIPTFLPGEKVKKLFDYPAGTVSVLVRDIEAKP